MTPAMLDAAEALRRAANEPMASDELNAFLEALASYGRETSQLATDDGREFLRQTAPLIQAARVPLHDYLDSAERFTRQEFYGDEWRGAVERRSKLEFVRALYRELTDVDWDTFLDTGDLDHVLHGKGQDEGGLSSDQIPAGTPSSHWWWWYPRNPPEATSLQWRMRLAPRLKSGSEDVQRWMRQSVDNVSVSAPAPAMGKPTAERWHVRGFAAPGARHYRVFVVDAAHPTGYDVTAHFADDGLLWVLDQPDDHALVVVLAGTEAIPGKSLDEAVAGVERRSDVHVGMRDVSPPAR